MMHRFVVFAIMCALGAFAAGCGTTPSSHFYTLSATAKPTTAVSSISVAVGPVSVPAVVDRPEIVVSTSANALRLDEFNRWASPIQDNIARVVAENLVAILGTPRVTLFPQTLSVDPDFRAAIEVLRLESTPGDAAALDAVWIVRQMHEGESLTGRTSVQEKTQDNGYEALAAAHSRAIARLSQDIADAIKSLQTAEPKSSSSGDKPSKP